MKLLIISAGPGIDEIKAEYGHAIDWISSFIHFSDIKIHINHIYKNQNFDESEYDGWIITGDEVRTDGDYFRIIGRKSEIINVGGQKVLPLEVETILLEADNVMDATVYGVPNQLMGSSVAARVSLEHDEDPLDLKARLRKFCLGRLTPYKVPTRFVIVSQSEQYNERVKKIRQSAI